MKDARPSETFTEHEVDTAQFGWVTVDPTPPVREIPEIDEETP